MPHDVRALTRGLTHCACQRPEHETRLVVVTGGPGAGKTAILDLARHRFCEHVWILPEVATMLFSGGFPRSDASDARGAAQRAIFSVQREIERVIVGERTAAIALCDRGTVDGLAYWPGMNGALFEAHGTTRAEELARYAAVIHLRTPPEAYYHQGNPYRIETAAQARAMDERIAAAWAGHPRVSFIESCDDFLDKARRALEAIDREVPACCRRST